MKAIVDSLGSELLKMRLPEYYEFPRFHTSIAWTSLTTLICKEVEEIPFGKKQLEGLEILVGRTLRDEPIWVSELVLKLGKEVTRYPLSG